MISKTLIGILQQKPKICVLTGAGVSAESGVPTFRGEEGIWRKFRAEELATVDAFMSNPDLVLAWYQHRRDIVDNIEPNPGHYALAKMEQLFPDFCLVTQNVDGLHRRAGSKYVLELHGNIMNNKCMKCNKPSSRIDFREGDQVPRCECGGMLRPDVVWFGEMLPPGVFEEASRNAFDAQVFFSIGTSAIVYPAAALPLTAKQRGAYLVEINVQETELSAYADEVLLGPSGRVLPKILEAAGIDK